MGLLDALKQYVADSMPGGLLNPEFNSTNGQKLAAELQRGLLESTGINARDKRRAWNKNQLDAVSGSSDTKASLNQQAYDSALAMAGMSPMGVVHGGKLAGLLNEAHPNVDAYLLEGSSGPVVLSKLVSKQPGAGTEFMNDLTALADKEGRTLALSPSSDFGGNKNRLIEFYKRFGFVPNKGRNIDFAISDSMYRNPVAD